MSASLWNHYQLVVSSLRAAHSSGSLVWDEWDGHHHSLRTLVLDGLGHIPSHTLYANACAPRFPHGEDNPNSGVRSYDVQNLPICRPRVQFAMQGCHRPFRILETR
jgi:hypothetical protein